MSRGQKPPPQRWDQRDPGRSLPQATRQHTSLGQPMRPNPATASDAQSRAAVYQVPPVAPFDVQNRQDASPLTSHPDFFPQGYTNYADPSHQFVPPYHSPSEAYPERDNPAYTMRPSPTSQQRPSASMLPSPIEPSTTSRPLGPPNFPGASHSRDPVPYQDQFHGFGHSNYAGSSLPSGSQRSYPVSPFEASQLSSQYQGSGHPRMMHPAYDRHSPATLSGSSIPVYGQTRGSSLPSPVHMAPKTGSNECKYSLYVRQQPRAARAGPDGKDRRPVDPPVVVQLQIVDFDPNSEKHLADLRAPYWVLHCGLFPVDPASSSESQSEENVTQSGYYTQRKTILGEYVSQAILSPKDPDPATARPHPTTIDHNQSRKVSTNYSVEDQPCVFFIFPDVSVRTPGLYRFAFMMCSFEIELHSPDGRCPVMARAESNVFKVHPAKGFDKVHESTPLIKGLAHLPGIPATLKLKKGPGGREKVKRHRDSDSQDSADSN